MTTDERLERLERRVAVLEALVRSSLQPDAAPEAAAAPAPPPPPPPPPPPRATPPPPPRSPAPPPSSPRPTVTSTVGIDERWIGQRGLLAVGVVALLMATGYILKL